MKGKVFLVCGIFSMVLVLFGCKKLPIEEGVNDTLSTEITNKDKTTPIEENEKELIAEEGAVLKFRSSDKEFATAVAERFHELNGIEVITQEGGAYDFNKGVLEGATGEGPAVFDG